jgi:hypothetical protein
MLHPRKGTPAVFRRNTIVGVWLLLAMLTIPLVLGGVSLALQYTVQGLVVYLLYVAAVAAVIWTTALSCPHCAMRGRCPASFYRPTPKGV